MRRRIDVLGRLRTFTLYLAIGATMCLLAPEMVQAEPMVFDKEIGYFKDMSYDALSDEGLTWEQKTRLFGGETVHYGPLTDAQRKAKQKELKDLLAKIDMKLVKQCDADIRGWLDKVVAAPLKRPGWEKNWRINWSVYTSASKRALESSGAVLLRAYEIWGDKKYLEAGLKRADIFLKAQFPRGPYRLKGGVCRIQDFWQTGPMRTILYAYAVSGDKKYLESAKKCADCLLPLQRDASGGWPDQVPMGGRIGSTGIVHGMSHNDAATTSPMRMMVLMYHLTGDKKYIAKLHKLGPFIKKSNLGVGKCVGWAEQYDDKARPVRARQYEFEVPNPKALTRSVASLLIWQYLMDGDEKHMDMLRSAYAWHETVRKKELVPWQVKAWNTMRDAWAVKWRGKIIKFQYRPGWPDAYLPDGSNWGRCLGYRIIPWLPTTPEMMKKYGHFIHNTPHSNIKKWAELARTGKKLHGVRLGGLTHSSAGNSLIQVRRALLEHKRGGYKGLLKYYSNPTKYTPDQYLQARVDAAKRALDARNVRVAGMRDKGMNKLGPYDVGIDGYKGRWYGAKYTKWGRAYDDYINNNGTSAWYQWQIVYDTMLAQGKISADKAARGGRGLQGVASMYGMDSWDVFGEVYMTVANKENLFDVPLEGRNRKVTDQK